MHARTKWTVIAGAVLVVAGGVVWLARPEAVAYDTAVVTRGDVEELLVEDARTRARWHLDLTASVSGEWRPAPLKAGDTLRMGALIGTLRVAPLDPQSAAQVRAQVGIAEASLAAAQSREAEVVIAAREARRARERTERLVASGGISDEQLDLARAADEARVRELEAARAQARAARFTLASARAVLPDGAAKALELRAPEDAIVLRVDEEHVRVLPAGAPLLQIGSLDDPEVVARVLSADAPKVHVGATLIVIAGDDTLRGRVTRVEPTAVTVRSALGVEEQRVPVIGDLPRGRARLGHEYQVEARIVVTRVDGALMVPLGALVRDGSAWSVFVRSPEGAILPRAVTVLARGIAFAAVTGVNIGETVILYPPESLESQR